MSGPTSTTEAAWEISRPACGLLSCGCIASSILAFRTISWCYLLARLMMVRISFQRSRNRTEHMSDWMKMSHNDNELWIGDAIKATRKSPILFLLLMAVLSDSMSCISWIRNMSFSVDFKISSTYYNIRIKRSSGKNRFLFKKKAVVFRMEVFIAICIGMFILIS